ncbi:STAS domain-containing protein [Saccharothrix texasensis]|uniref:Anti-sigma factor antagonist n=1 Tax=Saccharothrix texasensis TaxID=103734 RepID=A0A3N1H1Y3_9PSEU|nr:STAS domain-containing protein [Saccharothrix texasensis]ROP36426.1 anti-sigma B factor antagonist [Saccharothrix texasensis]
MELQVRSEVRGGWTVVSVSGELDADTVPVLSDRLEESTGNVVVDLSEVPFMDTTGLSLMLDWHRRLDGAGGEFRMASMQASVHKLFRLTELTEVMHIHETVESATTTT